MYQTIQPPNHLKKYIDCFWLGDDDDLHGNPNSHHSIASTKMELLFFCNGIYACRDANGDLHNAFKAGFYGHTTHFDHYVACAKRTTIFGIRFLPIAALALFKTPANELTNQKLDIHTVLGTHAAQLTEKIFEAKTFLQKIRVATAYFNRRIKELHLKYSPVEKIILNMKQERCDSIPRLVAESHLSQRQFERHFKELTGFSARTYLKLARFEQLVETIALQETVNDKTLTDLAHYLGYYDQAHFNRHFKEFTGVNPTAYFKNLSTQEPS